MEEKLQELKKLLAEIANLRATSAVLNWDQLVNMPAGAAEDRGEQIATVEEIIHKKSTSDELGVLLDDLSPKAGILDADSDDARMVKVAKRHFDKAVKIPLDYVSENARVTTVAQSVWEKAKIESKLRGFPPLPAAGRGFAQAVRGLFQALGSRLRSTAG